MQHILTLDDDPQIGPMLAEYLTEHGFRVTVADSGEHMLKVLKEDTVDLILLDINLPEVDGLTWARRIRAENDSVSVIMLTGRDSEVDRVVGLELGADDYLGKPFNLRELLARIKAVLRRAGAASGQPKYSKVSFAGWELNIEARRLVSPAGKKVVLTNTEFNLLLALVEHPHRVLSRDQLLEYSRRRPDEVFDRAIDYSIMQLRRKLEADPKRPRIIRTERSAGYIFSVDVEAH